MANNASHKKNIYPLAIVKSEFNQPVTDRMLQGAKNRLTELGYQKDHYTIVSVPGAVEIPIAAMQLASQGKYLAIIAIGAIIRGETDHYDAVCQQVSYGCQRVALDYKVPVIFGVLTTQNYQQAIERTGGNHGHKGIEAVDTAISIVSTLQEIDSTK
jgi:6,7-dimethyl-8-ribityllumazine synthase